MKSSTETLIGAMRILAVEIQSGDGVANAAIADAADRMEEMQSQLAAHQPIVLTAYDEIVIQDLRNDCNDDAVELIESLVACPPADALAIVQAALEAAAKICDDRAYRTESPDIDYCSQLIRAINPQSIIDAATKGQS